MNHKIDKLFKVLYHLKFPIYISNMKTNKIIYANMIAIDTFGYDILGENCSIILKNKINIETLFIKNIIKQYDNEYVDIYIILNTYHVLSDIDEVLNKILSSDENLFKYEYMVKSIQKSFEIMKNTGEIYFEFQPKLNNATLNCVGYEVLTRWKSIQGKDIYPSEFISFFMATGTVKIFDLFVFQNAFKFQEYLINNGIYNQCSINLSVTSFNDVDIINDICSLIDEFNIPTNSITIELLENGIIECNDTCYTNINKLKQKGFKLSIDDFGTGYSSLDKLYNLNIDELKISRELTLDIDLNAKKANVLKFICDLCEKSEIETVVEGIENEYTFELIKSMGFLNSQGYFHSKPLGKDQYIKYINFKNNILKESG